MYEVILLQSNTMYLLTFCNYLPCRLFIEITLKVLILLDFLVSEETLNSVDKTTQYLIRNIQVRSFRYRFSRLNKGSLLACTQCGRSMVTEPAEVS